MFVPLIFQKYKIGYETCLLSLKWTNIYGGFLSFLMIKITLSFRSIGVFHMIKETLYFYEKLNAARLLRRLMLFCYVMWSNCVGSSYSSGHLWIFECFFTSNALHSFYYWSSTIRICCDMSTFIVQFKVRLYMSINYLVVNKWWIYSLPPPTGTSHQTNLGYIPPRAIYSYTFWYKNHVLTTEGIWL
jgi:hypothetical protein